MKWILFFNLLAVLGLSLANTSGSIDDVVSSLDVLPSVVTSAITHQIKRRGAKRVVRDAFSGMSGNFFPRIGAKIISNCKADGHTDAATKLENAYDEMKTCLKKKTMFITPKNDYLNNLEECSKESIRLTKNCLADDQKYFPEFILDLAKSVVNFMYDDNDIMRVDLSACVHQFNRYDVRRSYLKCLTNTTTLTRDSNALVPTSKASFCQEFIPASHCFNNMIKDTCDRTSNVDKFREDFINSIKRPCDRKESSY